MASSIFITRVWTFSNLSNPFLHLNVFKFSSSFHTQITPTHPGLKLKHLLKAASDGLLHFCISFDLLQKVITCFNLICFVEPFSELMEDSKFVPLNLDDPTFGPPVSCGYFFTNNRSPFR